MRSGLTPEQQELVRYMSDLSEQAYCAGWMAGLEYALWEVVIGTRHQYGRLLVTEDHRVQLRRLSEACGGWIVCEDNT
jgi:hypothetical protein